MSTAWLVLCICAVVLAECDQVRVKRSKYYPYPPPGAVKYYRRPPPPSYPLTGPYSHTPPTYSGYEDAPRHVSRKPEYDESPSRFSRKPEGLADEDFKNLVRYLSKNDLDKIIRFAVDQDRRRQPADDDVEHKEYFKQRPSDENFLFNGPKVQQKPDDYRTSPNNGPINSYGADTKNRNYDSDDPNMREYPSSEDYNAPAESVDGAESRLSYKRILNQSQKVSDALPAPMNLRDHLEAAATGLSLDSYKVQGSGHLPLMDYHHSKQFSVDSYKVPHYYITSNTRPSEAHYGPVSIPKVEPAPAATAALARAQSDAHLKAVKIWNHHSQGKAYTLNGDGTLSVERPLRPNYGAP